MLSRRIEIALSLVVIVVAIFAVTSAELFIDDVHRDVRGWYNAHVGASNVRRDVPIDLFRTKSGGIRSVHWRSMTQREEPIVIRHGFAWRGNTEERLLGVVVLRKETLGSRYTWEWGDQWATAAATSKWSYGGPLKR